MGRGQKRLRREGTKHTAKVGGQSHAPAPLPRPARCAKAALEGAGGGAMTMDTEFPVSEPSHMLREVDSLHKVFLKKGQEL